MDWRATLEDIRRHVNVPWLILALVIIAFIWTNSLVPGEGSGNVSMGVMEMVHGLLRSMGLPYEWLTNFIVRKTAHFTEYMVLGFVMAQALDPERSLSRSALFATALACALVPSLDETIQLFVDGRSGQLTDVALDCCGAATGIALRSLAVRVRMRR